LIAEKKFITGSRKQSSYTGKVKTANYTERGDYRSNNGPLLGAWCDYNTANEGTMALRFEEVWLWQILSNWRY
jgi:hypothetical protein